MDKACGFETDVRQAADSGNWTDALRRHVAGCPDCRETQSVAAFMGRVADACGRHEPAPDPTLMLLRARLVRQSERDQRALRAQVASFGLTALAIAVTVLVTIRWIAPIITGLGDTAVSAGISLVLVTALVWFLGFRPVKNAR